MQELNEKHNHNRTENAIEAYIRTHIKTSEQKMKNESPWTEEEKIALQYFVDKKDKYRHTSGAKIGRTNWELILNEYKKIYPQTTRTQRALEHKLKSLRKKESIPTQKNLLIEIERKDIPVEALKLFE
jgi:hypothetical protein